MKEQQPPKTQHITVPNWREANKAVDVVTNKERCTLGSGYDYPLRWALFTKDAWSGEGMGYYVWETKDRKLDRLAANISVDSNSYASGGDS
jgi:hypothetical protein